MASLAIRYLPPASDELDAAMNWYAARDPAAADRFSRIFAAKLDEAAKSPHHWPLDSDGTRQIEVLAVAHCSREPGHWRDRLHD